MTDDAQSLKINRCRFLATAYDYRPHLGGVATCAYELSRAISQKPRIELKLIAPNSPDSFNFDAHNYFQTVRITLSTTSILAALTFSVMTLKQIFSYRPSAILHFLWMPEALSSLLVLPILRLFGIPYFIVTHGMEIMESDKNLKKRLRKRFSFIKKYTLLNASHIFAVSRYTATLLSEECEIPERKISVVNNGVDCKRFKPQCVSPQLLEKYKPNGRYIFLTVSRLDRYKGIDNAITALASVVRKHENVTYLICGEGPDRHRLEMQIKSLGLNQHALLLGAISNENLVEIYNLSDCFLLLTREDRRAPNCEGFGLVILEAAACGVPSIGAQSGGIPDVIIDGETGWLVEPSDVNAISSKMIESIENRSETKRRGDQALKRARTEMSWELMSEKVIEKVAKHVRH